VKVKVRAKVSQKRSTPPGERIPPGMRSPKAVKKKKKKQCAKRYL
jgi:hypothetical protein